MVAVKRIDEETTPNIREATYAEGWAMLEERARLYLGLNAAEFIARWDAGTFSDPDQPEVLRVAMLLPFVR